MSQVQEARCRIDIRVPLSVRNMIDRASSLQGRTRTDFIIATLVEKRLCPETWGIDPLRHR